MREFHTIFIVVSFRTEEKLSLTLPVARDGRPVEEQSVAQPQGQWLHFCSSLGFLFHVSLRMLTKLFRFFALEK